MKYETLIWSGCSHSFGSAFIEENIQIGADLTKEPVIWHHKKLKEDFPNINNLQEAIDAIKERAYPNQVGKKLGFKNTYNLSVQGKGIESQLRKVSSFIIENEDKIDMSKVVFCYQMPSLCRVEIFDTGNPNKFTYYAFNFQHIMENNNQFANDFFDRHFDFDYYTAKFLMYLYEYKGFLKSKGITFLPFEFYSGEPDWNKMYVYLRDETYIQKNMNNFTNWTHHNIDFPERKLLVEKIGFWINDFNFPTPAETLKTGGYHNDGHWSPKGHDAIAKNFSEQLKEKLCL
jgi:hypothetical protein